MMRKVSAISGKYPPKRIPAPLTEAEKAILRQAVEFIRSGRTELRDWVCGK